MKRLIVPVAALMVIGALLVGGAALLTRNDPHLTAPDDASHGGHGTATGIGLAPAPVTDPAPTAARLAVTIQPAATAQQGYTLEVRATQPDGKPAAEIAVRFFDVVELFGRREMFLAAARTDGRGVATYLYLPPQTGQRQIVVRSTGRDRTLTAGEGRAAFDARIAAAPYQPIRSNLAAFSDRVPYAAGLVVLSVWGLIAFALFGTARGVIGGARETSVEGRTG